MTYQLNECFEKIKKKIKKNKKTDTNPARFSTLNDPRLTFDP